MLIRLMDGVEVLNTRQESSAGGGEPMRFCLGRGSVIKGLDESVPKLQLGDKAKLTISPDLAYGAQGFFPVVPPNATLIIEVELISINDPP
mmetsp:Transcript_37497/g.58573  ORF Transcript_37497/g.58573 Transcript_37497/m.58573 type:complete len:91 (+) Transcript_37497:303-575(+)